MITSFTKLILHSFIALALITAVLLLAHLTANAQASKQNENAKAKQLNLTGGPTLGTSAPAAPIFDNFNGVKIGMDMKEVRSTLDHLKDRSEQQDFFVFTENQTAQVFYDKDGKVTAISVDYVGKSNAAPSPEKVLGKKLQPRPDGSLYELIRYPEKGFWVSYSKTSGDSPVTTVTMQKM
jgi:hypothetical protein